MRTSIVDGCVYEVPTHVSRVDSWKKTKTGHLVSGWHGWQVRWSGVNEFFSDAQYDTVKQAFLHACNYAKKHYPGHRHHCKHNHGVRLVRSMRKGRNVPEYSWEVSHPLHGMSPKRFYVGTDNTFTLARSREAFKRAWAYRRKIVKQHIKDNKLLSPGVFNGDKKEC